MPQLPQLEHVPGLTAFREVGRFSTCASFRDALERLDKDYGGCSNENPQSSSMNAAPRSASSGAPEASASSAQSGAHLSYYDGEHATSDRAASRTQGASAVLVLALTMAFALGSCVAPAGPASAGGLVEGDLLGGAPPDEAAGRCSVARPAPQDEERAADAVKEKNREREGEREEEKGALEAAFELLDGDSASSALARAVERNPNHPLAGEALARAGFIAYVKGDAEGAARFFELAAEAGVSDARMWRGLALLAAGRSETAAKVLREFADERADSVDAAVSLALAACELAAGETEVGADRCRRIIEGGGAYSVAASLLLRSYLPESETAEEADRRARLIAERYPLSYEAAVARHRALLIQREEEAAKSAGEAPAPAEELPEAGGETRETGAEVADEDVDESPGDGPVQVTFSVQVGAFSDIRNAEALSQRLIANGYDAVRVESETKKGILFHCVRVGHFTTRDGADALASLLEEKEGLGTSVLRTATRSSSSEVGAR